MKHDRILATLILAAVVLLGSVSAFAYPRQHRGGLFKNLNLTDDQKIQIRAIHQEHHAKMQDLAKQKLTRAEFRSQARQIRQDSFAKIKNVLTPDQRAKVEARRSARRRRSQT